MKPPFERHSRAAVEQRSIRKKRTMKIFQRIITLLLAFGGLVAGSHAATGLYTHLVRWFVRLVVVVLIGYFALVGVTGVSFSALPTGFSRLPPWAAL